MRKSQLPRENIIKKVQHSENLILNGFTGRKWIDYGIAKGCNLNVNLLTEKACEFRSFDITQAYIYFIN